jgi:hypothetical protein
MRLCRASLFLIAALVSALSAKAFTYSDGDLLLIFRRDGFNDFEFNLGSVNGYLSLVEGTELTVTNWDLTQVKANFNGNLAGASAILMSATGATDANRRVWITDGTTNGTPTDVSGSKWSQLRSKVSFVGLQAQAVTQTNSVQSYTASPSLESSYSFIASEGGRLDISTVSGLSQFPVETTIPATLRFFEVAVSNASEKPPSKQIGTFSLGTDGVLKFKAGGGTPVEPPVSQPTLAITRQGDTATISLQSQSGVKYRLRYATAANLTSSASSWAEVGSEVSGTGNTVTLQDTSSDPNRFYSVRAVR